jgi:hypothetical protein
MKSAFADCSLSLVRRTGIVAAAGGASVPATMPRPQSAQADFMGGSGGFQSAGAGVDSAHGRSF